VESVNPGGRPPSSWSGVVEKEYPTTSGLETEWEYSGMEKQENRWSE